MAKRRRRQAALLAGLGLAAGIGLPAVGMIQAAPDEVRPPVTAVAQVGSTVAQAELFTPRQEVPKVESSSPPREPWRTAVVIVLSAVLGLLAGAAAAAGLRGGRHYFRRDPRETQRLRESDREAQQQDAEARDSAAH